MISVDRVVVHLSSPSKERVPRGTDHSYAQNSSKKSHTIFMKFFQYSTEPLPAILQATSAYLRSFSLSGPSLSAPAISNFSYSDFHSFDRTKPMHETIPFHSILQRPEGSDCIRILI